MNRTVMPPSIAPPAANYAHAVLSDGASRLLHTAGVVPIAPDGSVPDGIGAQAEVIWSNIGAILESADMTMTDIVAITTYVVHGEDLGPVTTARDTVFAGHIAASTLVTVPALVRPEWKVEIAAVAAA